MNKNQNIPLVFIHGYLESADIWTEFLPNLSSDVPVFVHNLPGHGGILPLAGESMMEKWADDLNWKLEKSGFEKVVLVGHSMGGYLASTFLKKHPEKIAGLCLFHSLPFADNDDKKNARRRGLADLAYGLKDEIIRAHAPKIYAEENRPRFVKQIDRAIENAIKMTNYAVAMSISAMMHRVDCSSEVSNLNAPFLLIHGRKDTFIASENVAKLELPAQGELVILENSGHAGFNEEPEKSAQILTAFWKKCVGF